MTVRPPITVAQYGIGPIGAEIARLLLTKSWIKVIAAVDVDPAKVGRDLGDVIGLGHKVGVVVTPTLDVQPMAVAHSTGSRLSDVEPQLLALLEKGCHVVSTCEELSYPLHAAIRENLQKAARSANVTILGTGVNPGFVMDKLPLTITSVCQEIRRIEVTRVVDASKRREPLQRKVGAGMSEADFRAAVAAGNIRHMGLRESLMLIADGLNVAFDRVSDESIDPVMAEGETVTDYFTIRKGQVAGVHQHIEGIAEAMTVTLDIKMYIGARNAADCIKIDGTPNVALEIHGGVHGDRATAAMVVNAIPRAIAARPGVLTMDDIPISFR